MRQTDRSAGPARQPLASRLAWVPYQVLFGAALLVVAPVALARRWRHYQPTLGPRLGFPPEKVHEGETGEGDPPEGSQKRVSDGVWMQAVSVGEVAVAATLAKELPEDLPLVVTTTTPTGQLQARRSFQRRRQAGPTAVAYFPFDLGWPVARFFRRFQPRLLILLESELWPLVLATARRRRVPVVVVNARVSDDTRRKKQRLLRLGWLRPFLDLLHGPVSHFGVQTPADRERLLEQGVAEERITVTGNLKYDSPEPSVDGVLEERLRQLAGERAVLVAGSTMAGEDEAVLDAFTAVGAGGRALLILVPRHPERWDGVADLVRSRGFRLLRRSEMAATPSDQDPPRRPDVLLLDSLGELAGLYRLASAAFIGGSLVATGGHNVLEAARFGVPVVVGPHMFNFRQIAEDFQAAQAWAQVEDTQGLATAWRRWMDHPQEARDVGERGRRLIEANRGAVGRTLELLAPYLEPLLSTGPRATGTSTPAFHHRQVPA